MVSGSQEIRSKSDQVSVFSLSQSLKSFYPTYREGVDEMFKSLDKDNDGKLSWREFVGEETTIERTFKLFDENQDGTITKKVKI